MHYHLRRGGVTHVIAAEAAGLGRRGHAVVVLSGEPLPGGAVMPAGARVRVVPGLGYADPGGSGRPGDVLAAMDVEARAALGGPPDVWHFHNHALGKNPAVSAVPALLAVRGDALVLHTHDFAEDGRPSNYRALDGVRDRLYPVGERIRHVVLSHRDREALGSAGVPASGIRLVPNPVSAPPASPTVPAASGSDRLLYPARGIRRKNLGEAVLLARVLAGDFRVAVTLPPENPVERASHDAWAAFASARGIPVGLGVGARPGVTLGGLLAESLAVLTTSVREGFGLAYLEPWLACRAVTGRAIPSVVGDFREAGIRLDDLYDRLPVPVGAAGGKDLLTSKVRTAIGADRAAMGVPMEDGAVGDAVAWIVDGDGMADFGMLPVSMQRALIDVAGRSDALRSDIARLARPSRHRDVGILDANAAVIRRDFSVDGHAARIDGLLGEVAGASASTVRFADAGRLRDFFLRPDFLRLVMHDGL